MSLLRATEKIPNGIPTFPQTPNSRRQTDQRRRRMPPSITPSPNSRTRNTPGYEPPFLHPHHPAWMLPKNDGFSVAELKQDQKRKHSFHCHGLWQTLGGKISQPVWLIRETQNCGGKEKFLSENMFCFVYPFAIVQRAPRCESLSSRCAHEQADPRVNLSLRRLLHRLVLTRCGACVYNRMGPPHVTPRTEGNRSHADAHFSSVFFFRAISKSIM